MIDSGPELSEEQHWPDWRVRSRGHLALIGADWALALDC